MWLSLFALLVDSSGYCLKSSFGLSQVKLSRIKAFSCVNYCMDAHIQSGFNGDAKRIRKMVCFLHQINIENVLLFHKYGHVRTQGLVILMK